MFALLRPWLLAVLPIALSDAPSRLAQSAARPRAAEAGTPTPGCARRWT